MNPLRGQYGDKCHVKDEDPLGLRMRRVEDEVEQGGGTVRNTDCPLLTECGGRQHGSTQMLEASGKQEMTSSLFLVCGKVGRVCVVSVIFNRDWRYLPLYCQTVAQEIVQRH